MLLLGAVVEASFGLGTDYLLRAAALFVVTTSVVGWLALVTGLERFGPANRITLLRVALVALVAAAIGEAPTAGLAWFVIVTMTTALFLDGFDGRVARRSNTVSAFGARFDMETDAALILILCVLCWQFDKAGPWILAAGAMRYAFVAAGYALPWLRAPLPYSRRRQATCIWQSGLLLGVLSPIIPQPASSVLAAGTLIMLGTSFAIDVYWLWQHRRVTPSPSASCTEP